MGQSGGDRRANRALFRISEKTDAVNSGGENPELMSEKGIVSIL